MRYAAAILLSIVLGCGSLEPGEVSGGYVRFEGEARGVGFVVLLPDNKAVAVRELELGFEPSLERQPH